ncbi:alpha/beta hydrolase [Marinobacterium aestuarii]|uniref:Alpha/beta hydrolase n=1 Tax=Marinobacterium aestuarii TaxID=1821621 RepID=A0A1A9F487_9GAMM|nr:alpha/beta hydrolase [Marinobacterium aestuarii]ANG64661.1 alpha/beta hydrolase [Marinobacterium aestuarii]
MGCIRTGKGPVLVLVHGFLSGLSYWHKQVENFSSHFDVIALDLPGYGGETRTTGPARIEDFADCVLHQLDKLGVENFYLMGHSMGGMIAQEIALKAPDRVTRLVLYCTGPNGRLPGRFEPLEESIRKVCERGTEEPARYTVPTWFTLGTEDPDCQEGIEMALQVSRQTYINGLKAMGGWSAEQRLGSIRAQTLVLWADRDRTYMWQQPEALWKGIKGANLAVIPQCAHNAHLEKSHVFNQIVFDFINRRDG